jgi:hypothetical protein
VKVGHKRLARAAALAGTALATKAIPMTTAAAARVSPAIRHGALVLGGSADGTSSGASNTPFGPKRGAALDGARGGYQQRAGGSGQNQALAWNGAKWTVG